MMKDILRKVWTVLLYIWELPQNIVGLVLLLVLKGERRHYLKGMRFYYLDTFPGGITLGEYIVVGTRKESTVRHEFGHVLQSRILGPLYLLVIGLPSLVHAWINGYIGCCDRHDEGYYHFYTERWANRLTGLK